MRFARSSPHTWMGIANNARYPTAEEIFHGSNSHLNRRSSANASTIRSQLGNKPTRMFIATPVAEKDEQDDSNGNTDNTAPLIGSALKIVPIEKTRNSTTDVVRPLYRDDIFFGASLTRLPQYTSRTSLGYHLAVTHVPTKEEEKEEKEGRCRLCPEAVRRILATMLDVSLFKSPTFIVLALSGFFTMLGFFVPFMYVTGRAKDEGIAESTAVMLVSTIGIANIVGRIACGLVSSMPKMSPLWLNNIAVSAGGIATMLSGICFHEAYQFTYCVVFGLSVGE